MEDTKIAVCDGLAEALLVWALAHFVFHKKLGTRNTNWLLRTMVLDVEQDTEPVETIKEELEFIL